MYQPEAFKNALYLSQPLRGIGLEIRVFCSHFAKNKDVLVLFVAIPTYLRSGKTLGTLTFTYVIQKGDQIGKNTYL